MALLKSTAGYAWGVLCILVVLATFLGHGFLEERFAKASGIRIHPRMTGGEAVRTIERGGYTVTLHRPVFDGLISDRRTGFVRVDFTREDRVPPVIEEQIDWDGDGRHDFSVVIDTGTSKVSLRAAGPGVTGIEQLYVLKRGWAVRVGLTRAPAVERPAR
jgi:hypothetical protein